MAVAGRVQGVTYRASCQAEAGRLGVTGWVRNQPGGGVLVEAQGDHVDDLVAWCRAGPPGARVDSVEVTELDPVGGETGFEVRG